MMLGNIRKYRVFYALATLALLFSYAFDGFGAMNTAAFVQNFKDSEALVVNEVRCGGNYYSAQMLELKKVTTSNTQAVCQPDALKPYSSQFGLQGKVYTFGYKVVHAVIPIKVGTYVIVAQLLTALLSAAVLGLVALWARVRFGRTVAAIVVGMLALSPMLVGFGRNLYWALPLMVLPFIFALYYYRAGATIKRQVYFWIAVGLLLYIRFLCGYEYLTTLTIMVAAAVGYHLWMAGARRDAYLKQFGLVLGVAVLGFVLALGTHIVSLHAYAGSYTRAASIIKQRAMERTTHSSEYLAYPIQGLRTNLPDQYAIANSYLDLDTRSQKPSQLWASWTSFLNYLYMPVVTWPITINQPLATYVQSLAFILAILIWLYVRRAKWVARGQMREVEALFIGAGIGLIGFLSWLILARAHSLVHAHINGILLQLPFALFGYMIIGLYVVSRMTAFRKRLKR